MPEQETKTWIQSASGLRVPLQVPDPATLKIEDIAYALAGINRYTGHARPRYNVAEHCYHVSHLASHLARQSRSDPSHIRLCARWGLMHDAAEAYIGDVSRPLKNVVEMAGYKAIEKRWDEAIAVAFGLPPAMPPEVREADYLMLGVEAHQIMAPVHPAWGETCPGGTLPPANPGLVLGWGPPQAEKMFLARFRELWPVSP